MAWRVPTSDEALTVRFWGVRGSTCASGAEFVEFGGHTPCVEVRCGVTPVRGRCRDRDRGPRRRPSGRPFPPRSTSSSAISTSTISAGCPSSSPRCSATGSIRTYCGHLDGASAAEALDRLFAPPIFPIRLDQLPARFEHHGFKAGETLTFPDGAEVGTHPLNHPGRRDGIPVRVTGAARSATSATSSIRIPGRIPGSPASSRGRRPRHLRRHVLREPNTARAAAGAIPPGRRASSSARPPT